MGVIIKNGIWYCGRNSSGGGGGGKITSTFKIESTTLYNGATRDFPVTLSDSINNYDLIKITFGWQAPLNDGSYSLCEPIYQTPDKLKENTLFTFWDYYYIYFAITDKTFSSVQAELNVGCLYQIEGLKFVVDSVGGGASESTSFEPVLLWEEAEDNSTGQTLTMNQSIDDFDAVMIEGCLYLSTDKAKTQYENRLIFKNSYYNKSQSEENWGLILYNGTVSSVDSKRRVIGRFIDNKTLYIAEASDAKLTKIYGLKFNSIVSNRGENEYKTLLSLEDGIITAPSSGSQYTQETVLQEFTLQDDINNYDQILIKNHVGPHYWNNQADLINESILYPKLYDGSIFTLGEPSFDDVNYYNLMQVSIYKNKLKVHFNVTSRLNYSKIEVFGVKNGGSSSSGSDSTEGLTDEQLATLASETITAAWPQ